MVVHQRGQLPRILTCRFHVTRLYIWLCSFLSGRFCYHHPSSTADKSRVSCSCLFTQSRLTHISLSPTARSCATENPLHLNCAFQQSRGLIWGAFLSGVRRFNGCEGQVSQREPGLYCSFIPFFSLLLYLLLSFLSHLVILGSYAQGLYCIQCNNVRMKRSVARRPRLSMAS
jgi:hypothetical protein